uniref:DUF6701 domain-containing protein n=1 Tax=Hydrogenimonas sp. TaxID=2231112 RepID=UPI00262B14E5
KYMRNGEANGSMAGSLTGTISAFSDGEADLRLSFDDVGIVTLELNDTSWCAVDADDTPEINRTIYGERNVTFIPHHFRVEFIASPRMEDNDTAGGFTYLSNDLHMSAWLRNLSLKVTAEGEKGGTMRNFSNPMNRLFADPVDITPLLSLPAKHSPARTLGEPLPKTGADLGFASGEAVLSYSDVAFNYDRTYDEPTDPFHVAGSEGNLSVTLQDATYPSVAGGVVSNFSGGATFYFGRLRAEDVATTERSVENVVEIEVYDRNAPSFVTGFRQNSLRWYRNEKQSSRMNGGIKDANATADIALSSPSDTDILMDFSRYGNGTVTMEINTTVDVPRKRIIHLDIDSWLWYVPKGFGSPYAYDGASDCTKHPCFGYTYIGKGRIRGVQSGEINGSDFDTGALESNATYRRRQGVKLFR